LAAELLGCMIPYMEKQDKNTPISNETSEKHKQTNPTTEINEAN
jgi:hypothetical protein